MGVWIDFVLFDCVLLLCFDLWLWMILLGFVVVFGVSNFLFVFLIVGGDIVFVFVVGCLVVVKGYLVYLVIGVLVVKVICKVVVVCGMLEGVFGYFVGLDNVFGVVLVKDLWIVVVGFIGLCVGGLVLVKLV